MKFLVEFGYIMFAALGGSLLTNGQYLYGGISVVFGLVLMGIKIRMDSNERRGY